MNWLELKPGRWDHVKSPVSNCQYEIECQSVRSSRLYLILHRTDSCPRAGMMTSSRTRQRANGPASHRCASCLSISSARAARVSSPKPRSTRSFRLRTWSPGKVCLFSRHPVWLESRSHLITLERRRQQAVHPEHFHAQHMRPHRRLGGARVQARAGAPVQMASVRRGGRP